MKTPYMMQWNFNAQRELLPGWALMLGYVGSRGIGLPRFVNPNSAIPDILPDGRFFFPDTRNGVRTVRRYPAFTTTSLATNGADSWYNSGQLSLQKRFSHGFQFQVSYNYSRSIDTHSGTANSDFGNVTALPQNYYAMKAQRSVSAFDLTHTFNANSTWEIPIGQGMSGIGKALLGGWSLNGIFSRSSGTPVNIEIPVTLDNARDRTTGTEQRPNLVAGRTNNPILGSPDRWFDGASFELPQAGFYGNLGRLTGRGASFVNLDMSLSKATNLRENVKLQFRAEFFNILNHANFSPPTGTNRMAFLAGGVRNTTFGKVTGTSNASRQIQFALKLVF